MYLTSYYTSVSVSCPFYPSFPPSSYVLHRSDLQFGTSQSGTAGGCELEGSNERSSTQGPPFEDFTPEEDLEPSSDLLDPILEIHIDESRGHSPDSSHDDDITPPVPASLLSSPREELVDKEKLVQASTQGIQLQLSSTMIKYIPYSGKIWRGFGVLGKKRLIKNRQY